MKDASGKLLAKAERSIAAARRLLDAGDAEFAAARAYYAMFYVAEALLNERGLRFRKHGGVHGGIGEHLVKTGELDPKYHRWLLDAFNKRVTADYGVEAEMTAPEVAEMIVQGEDFLATARRMLGV